jgi:hypothetical protein
MNVTYTAMGGDLCVPGLSGRQNLIFENDYFRLLAAICSSNAIILFVLRM